NAKLHRLAQAIVAIPTMFNNGVVRGLHPRVEKQQSWFDRSAYLIATPISGRQTPTEVRLFDRDDDGCRDYRCTTLSRCRTATLRRYGSAAGRSRTAAARGNRCFASRGDLLRW